MHIGHKTFGAGEFVLETLQYKQVEKGVTREEKSTACKVKFRLKPEITWLGI